MEICSSVLLCGSVDDNSTANSVRLEGCTSCVPGTTSITATIHGVNTTVTEYEHGVTGDVSSCRSAVQAVFGVFLSRQTLTFCLRSILAVPQRHTTMQMLTPHTAKSDGHLLSQ